METNTIFTQLEELKKQMAISSLSTIEKDLVKMQLLECYELVLNKNVTHDAPANTEVVATSFVASPTLNTQTDNVEINPFIAEIEEPTPIETKQTIVEPKIEQDVSEVKASPLTAKTDEAESIHEHFEHEGASLNDKFQLTVNKGLNEKTAQGDLKKLIDFNRQFVFIQELFNNDATAYMRTIEHLNNSASLEEAFAYLNKEIVHFYKWRPDLQSVKLFEKLVRQKFGA
jgi:hypothetical protein